ncbi:MAG: hypothetical protein WC807_14610 [Hyphomicrobium sp.]|jgi:hypothetical protein
MAVSQFFRNEHARLETGKAPATRVCTRCRLNAVNGRDRTCGPCQVDAHDRRQAAIKARSLVRAQSKPQKARIEPESVHQLGRAARRAGLTLADLNAMDPPLSPEDERLLSHG